MSDETGDDSERGYFTARNILIALLAVGLFVGAIVAYKAFSKPAPKGKPTAQQIQLVRPNTPPPPPPKPPEKPPEPPKMKEEVKIEQPKIDQPKAEAPPAERLGVDAVGTGTGDGFGLASNPGGRDVTQSGEKTAGVIGGGGTGINRNLYAFYRDTVTRHLNDELNRVNELKDSAGQVGILVWVDKSGKIERVDLRDATPRQSELIRSTLLSGKPLREAPPEAMPQPVWIVMNLRDLG
jgi:periplasmic protein TonB